MWKNCGKKDFKMKGLTYLINTFILFNDTNQKEKYL